MGRLHILTRQSSRFSDRRDAGRLLAGKLQGYRAACPVVLGVPRGGVVTAFEIANALEAEMDVVLAHKLGAPGNPEFAVGAVSEKGGMVLAREAGRIATASYLKQEKERQEYLLSARMKQYRAVLPKISLKDRVVVLTDDGVAVGLTMEASLVSVRTEKPARIIVALPVGPSLALERLSARADETIALCAPPDFFSVSQYYDYFSEVDDRDVMDILRQESLRRQGVSK